MTATVWAVADGRLVRIECPDPPDGMPFEPYALLKAFDGAHGTGDGDQEWLGTSGLADMFWTGRLDCTPVLTVRDADGAEALRGLLRTGRVPGEDDDDRRIRRPVSEARRRRVPPPTGTGPLPPGGGRRSSPANHFPKPLPFSPPFDIIRESRNLIF